MQDGAITYFGARGYWKGSEERRSSGRGPSRVITASWQKKCRLRGTRPYRK